MELFIQLSSSFVFFLIFLALFLHHGVNDASLQNIADHVPLRNLAISGIQWLRKPARPMGSRTYWACVLLLTLVALAVRLWQFGSIPGGFNQDGAMAAVDAKALADYGTDRFGMPYPVHFTAWRYGQMSVLLSYLMVPFIKLFGLSAITARLPLLLSSLVGLWVLFLFARSLLGKGPALAVLALAAINPWHILQSRWALDCNMYSHMFIIGIYFLYKGTHNTKYLYLSMVFFALCMYSYGVAFLTLPVFLILALITLLIEKAHSIKSILIAILVYFGLSWPIWTTMLINTFRWETISTPFFTMPFFPESMRSKDILFFVPNKLPQLAANAKSLVQLLFEQAPEAPWNSLDHFGSLYLISMPFVFLGIFFFLKQWLLSTEKSTRIGIALVLATFATSLWAGLVITEINTNRLNFVYYSLLVLAGAGVWQCYQWLAISRPLNIALYTLLFTLFCFEYFGEYSRNLSFYFNKGAGDAIKTAQALPYQHLHVTRDGLGDATEILTIFHDNIDAKYFQGKTNQLHGKQCLPYAVRYIYGDLDEHPIDPSTPDAYILSQKEVPLFVHPSFVILPFQKYSLAFPRSLAKGTSLEARILAPVNADQIDPKQLIGQQDWGELGIDGPANQSGQGFVVNNQKYLHGIGTHGSSQYYYSLHNQYQWFTVTVGISDDVACSDGVIFRIKADGLTLWESDMVGNFQTAEAKVSLKNAKSLQLETDPGPTNTCDHANWMEPKLIRAQ